MRFMSTLGSNCSYIWEGQVLLMTIHLIAIVFLVSSRMELGLRLGAMEKHL